MITLLLSILLAAPFNTCHASDVYNGSSYNQVSFYVDHEFTVVDTTDNSISVYDYTVTKVEKFGSSYMIYGELSNGLVWRTFVGHNGQRVITFGSGNNQETIFCMAFPLDEQPI